MIFGASSFTRYLAGSRSTATPAAVSTMRPLASVRRPQAETALPGTQDCQVKTNPATGGGHADAAPFLPVALIAIQIRFGRVCLRRPIQTAFNPGAIRLCQGPELAFGYHGRSSEHDASILESFQAQRLARITLAEGYLATSARGLEFSAVRIDFCIHAIMPSCS